MEKTDEDEFNPDINQPQQFIQAELLLRDLGLSKDAAQILGSRLKDKNMLALGTTFSCYMYHEKDFAEYISQEGSLVYCNNIREVVMKLGANNYDSTSSKLFIDSSMRSLKCVLLHNCNTYASMPVAHSVHLIETKAFTPRVSRIITSSGLGPCHDENNKTISFYGSHHDTVRIRKT